MAHPLLAGSETPSPVRAWGRTVASVRRAPAPRDFDGWVSQLGVSSCRQRARVHLLTSGPDVVPALRRGLRHRKAIVRRTCVRILDQLVDEDTVPDLVAALDDEDTGVRAAALHSLACDRCKQGECRPGEDLWVPRALALLDDPDPDLRAAAIDALGKVVDHRPEVEAALRRAADSDRDKGLRSMALGRLSGVGG
jgi:HEAT repeat protein